MSEIGKMARCASMYIRAVLSLRGVTIMKRSLELARAQCGWVEDGLGLGEQDPLFIMHIPYYHT